MLIYRNVGVKQWKQVLYRTGEGEKAVTDNERLWCFLYSDEWCSKEAKQNLNVCIHPSSAASGFAPKNDVTSFQPFAPAPWTWSKKDTRSLYLLRTLTSTQPPPCITVNDYFCILTLLTTVITTAAQTKETENSEANSCVEGWEFWKHLLRVNLIMTQTLWEPHTDSYLCGQTCDVDGHFIK